MKRAGYSHKGGTASGEARKKIKLFMDSLPPTLGEF